MWAARVAHRYGLPASVVRGWRDDDLLSAVTDLVIDAERCPGCGLSEDDAKIVAAEQWRCPTCEDRDRQLDKIDRQDRFGRRVRFATLSDPEEAAVFSSWARFTQEGMSLRAKVRARLRRRA